MAIKAIEQVIQVFNIEKDNAVEDQKSFRDFAATNSEINVLELNNVTHQNHSSKIPLQHREGRQLSHVHHVAQRQATAGKHP